METTFKIQNKFVDIRERESEVEAAGRVYSTGLAQCSRILVKRLSESPPGRLQKHWSFASYRGLYSLILGILPYFLHYLFYLKCSGDSAMRY